MIYLVFVCGLYLIFIGIVCKVDNTSSGIVFKIIPVLLGLILALSVSPTIFGSPHVFIK